MNTKELVQKALDALEFSYSPYSRFRVGAALLCEDGTVFTGCNVENAAFGPSICAERVAVTKAVSEGHRDFAAIAIVGGADGRVTEYCPPCGVCRQVLSEFSDGKKMKVILAISPDETREYTLEELLPLSFNL
ncbi:MAG: cytidine deaminase [Eubacterium sp.]|nr:cytidine deaminase [Eubacterium sp.]